MASPDVGLTRDFSRSIRPWSPLGKQVQALEAARKLLQGVGLLGWFVTVLLGVIKVYGYET